ncbi:uncharacterized protein TRIADDRAFT_34083 [Trichoplax adhaerens]|uniref:Mitochondrial Rho GTPase n=1 Tax=Trichoplax adhaerens TaxID=10228 RepID=B3SDQ1_TRIAD|nr:hypothetical protein TRIADDRAFT_34083 [Trichoplax adhaerens]EDV19136.1 hypothetical protein TRIADDRAFT_34083 [Trichoplax adhaerens]|eukprot:XP_002118369.1 hypothetical protein TRIADDRAFT_34083 [Trichoplax adhaerens]
MKKDVRILLVGDAGSGKTSLISSLVTEEFQDQVPDRAEEITIPADVTPEKVPTHIADYSEKEQSDEDLTHSLKRANVVCLVYAVNNEESIERITSYWLPFIESAVDPDSKLPIILVGNKSDLAEESSMRRILPIMNEHKMIETCIECSAKELKNITELFYYAQKAVLHPTAPLYASQQKQLTESCRKALTRVFKVCDMDNDGALNDAELFDFQKYFFSTPLQNQALKDVKNVVKKSKGSVGVNDHGITLAGFLFLHTLFIQRARHETTWTVLRKFGYNDDLEFRDDYIYPDLRTGPDCVTELSQMGYQFLTRLFHKYDKDLDGALSPDELRDLFSTCPRIPWEKDIIYMITVNSNGWITLAGFLAWWSLTTYRNVSCTLEYLAYLGYIMGDNVNQLSAISVTRNKANEPNRKQLLRNILVCDVVGAPGVGKVIDCLDLLLFFEYCSYIAGRKSEYTINTVEIYGQERYLAVRKLEILHEVNANDPKTASDLVMLSNADAVCLVYSNSDKNSFQYIAKVHKILQSKVTKPVMIIATKSDTPAVTQNFDMQPSQYCYSENLGKPQSFSATGRRNAKVYKTLATAAAFP